MKRLPAGTREEIQAEVVFCYQTFIRGLLDLTDNIVSGRVVTPARVVRQDGDDAYLVVAADKGTATFSDTANAISIDYAFWLGDAFASGGSAGYDHKKMAITARGAWECVKRHFREIGFDMGHAILKLPQTGFEPGLVRCHRASPASTPGAVFLGTVRWERQSGRATGSW